MSEITVFVRIALFALSGYAVRGGWLPEDMAQHLTHPETVEVVSGLVLGAVTLVAYVVSRARKALRDA